MHGIRSLNNQGEQLAGEVKPSSRLSVMKHVWRNKDKTAQGKACSSRHLREEI
jgi:hypothetical protein